MIQEFLSIWLFCALVLWLLSALFHHTYFLYFFQLKEYRFDRLRDFFQSKNGKATILSYTFVYRFILGTALFILFSNAVHVYALLAGLLLCDIFFFFYTLRKKIPVLRPKFTLKVKIFLSLLLSAELFFLHIVESVHGVYIFLAGRFFIAFAILVVIEFFARSTKRFLIFLATKKMQRYPNMKRIGITGSYGKSSVKEFLSFVLEKDFLVVKTPKNINSEVGIAMFILKTSFNQAQIFVCEMGAYRKGEIAIDAKMVCPEVGILTAVNEQHLSLFGSIKKTQQAKYELLRAIPKDGYVITNADNKYCTEYLDELKANEIETFGYDDENNPDFLITNIQKGKNGVEFSFQYKDIESVVETNLLGKHHPSNLAVVCMAAMYMGMSFDTIKEACTSLPAEAHGTAKVYRVKKSVIIDDSYNSNPTGFRAALDLMHEYSSDKKRVVITRGMIELGEKSEEIHRTIADEIAYIADELIVISDDVYEYFQTSVAKKYNMSISKIVDHQELLKKVEELVNEKSVILLENRIPSAVMDFIHSKKEV